MASRAIFGLWIKVDLLGVAPLTPDSLLPCNLSGAVQASNVRMREIIPRMASAKSTSDLSLRSRLERYLQPVFPITTA